MIEGKATLTPSALGKPLSFSDGEPLPDPSLYRSIGTSAHGLLLHSSSSLALQGYTDVDWASCPDDRKNTSGSCLFFIPNLISYNAESEYRSLVSLTTEIV
ncbi:hypothetical protein AAG906_005777 [Vitis piasezkii]